MLILPWNLKNILFFQYYTSPKIRSEISRRYSHFSLSCTFSPILKTHLKWTFMWTNVYKAHNAYLHLEYEEQWEQSLSLSVNTLIDAVWQIEVTSKWAIIWLRQLRLWSLRKRLYDDELIHDDQVTSKDSLLLDGRREYCIGNSPRRPLEEQLNKKQLLRRGNGPPQDLTACRGNRDVDLNWESVIWLRWLT